VDRRVISETDVVLIGAGIMSSTLGFILKELEPGLTISIFEALDDSARESSDSWNNAGTGHAANCELNYTPQLPDGSVDIRKALQVNTEFDLSREFWSHLIETGAVKDPRSFIHPVPHMSFVMGAQNVAFLKERHRALSHHHCFASMEYSEDHAEIADWAPLIMEGRAKTQPVAATRIETGTDVDYGSLTKHILARLCTTPGFAVHYGHRITRISKENGRWRLEMRGKDGQPSVATAKYVFLGAGGGALPLLQKSGIAEAKGYGGFPVSGIWLRCDVESVGERHHAKVYGKAPSGSPPMSVPHLDTRIIGGKRSLLFGPYAGFSTKFLKHGSYLDVFRSLNSGNIQPMLTAGYDNLGLTKYLVSQVLQSSEKRFAALQDFFPQARPDDWKLQVAGQRVQTIKPDPQRTGYLEFGTELLPTADGSLVALLGASPGASTSAAIAVRVIATFYPELIQRAALKAMMPSFGTSLIENADALHRTRERTSAILRLDDPVAAESAMPAA